MRSTKCFFLQNISPPASRPSTSLIVELEDLIQGGITIPGPDEENQIKSLMVQIGNTRKGDQRKKLTGRWELIFTTEKEINFFKESWPFAKVSSITQDIDPYGSYTVNNLISFEGGGEFAVTGSVEPADSDSEYDRVTFEFQEAVIQGWGRKVKVPPVGSGWFDTMFCDGNYRLSRDNRGDWSVFKIIE